MLSIRKQHWFYSALPLDLWAPHCQGESGRLECEGNSFWLQSHPFGHYPVLTAIGEGWNICPQCLHYCQCHTSPNSILTSLKNTPRYLKFNNWKANRTTKKLCLAFEISMTWAHAGKTALIPISGTHRRLELCKLFCSGPHPWQCNWRCSVCSCWHSIHLAPLTAEHIY